MNLVKVDKSVIEKSFKSTKLDAIVDEFIAMDVDVVETKGWREDYMYVESCANSINIALKRRKINSVKAIIRKKTPYLVKTRCLV